MTVQEIFSEISAHMVQGIMTHQQLSQYYAFLNLKGYSKCHEFHFLKESKDFQKLNKYFIYKYNKLIPQQDHLETPDIIPKTWYNHVQKDADRDSKRQAVENGLQAWVMWENKTSQFYEKKISQLQTLGEIESADFILKLLKKTSKELLKAQENLLNKNAINYDINIIISQQEEMQKKFK